MAIFEGCPRVCLEQTSLTTLTGSTPGKLIIVEALKLETTSVKNLKTWSWLELVGMLQTRALSIELSTSVLG